MANLRKVAETLAAHGQNDLAREVAAVSLLIKQASGHVEADASYDREIAQTILQQMGGLGRLKIMIGLKAVTIIPNGVKFAWPNKQRSQGNVVAITLEPSDTYKVEFFNGSRSVKVYDDVYAEDLKDIFEKQTGWYLSL